MVGVGVPEVAFLLALLLAVVALVARRVRRR
jgi:hypothetical protein